MGGLLRAAVGPVRGALIGVAMALTGCSQPPSDALVANQVTEEIRSLETRTFETADAPLVLAASAQVLQDLGFTLTESEPKLGLLVGEKIRPLAAPGTVDAVFAQLGAGDESSQRFHVSLVVSPQPRTTVVRVTFTRTLFGEYGQELTTSRLDDPELYQGFFEKLSEACFLEVHKV